MLFTNPTTAGEVLTITPAQMQLSGDVTSQANCQDATVCQWAAAAPQGAILLGVDPSSPLPANWDGGSAMAEVDLTGISGPTLLVLKVGWLGGAGRGLHSPEKNRLGAIWFDGKPLWEMRTLTPGTFGDYYAEDRNDIITTLVVRQAGKHTLQFLVSPHTAWDISKITLTKYALPETYRGIGYSPYRDCQMPGGSEAPTSEQIDEDIFRITHTSNTLRTYSALGPNAGVPAKAIQAGLAVFPGAWLDFPATGSAAIDESEVQGLITLACQNNVAGVIVGNEYYLRNRSADSINYLKQRIQQVREGIEACGKQVPITTAEIDSLAFTWASDSATTPTGINPSYRPILDSLDFFMVHIYPFWSGLPIDGAANLAIQRYLAMQARLQQEYPGQNKWLIIGETGWPSSGGANGQAVPSLVNQRRYLTELLPLVEKHDVNLLYFDGFDELWKIEEPGGVGQRWGYAYSDRSAKHNFYGVLVPSAEVLASPMWVNNWLRLPIIVRGGSTPAQAETSSVVVSSPPFAVYNEWPSGPGHFQPTGWMGDLDKVEMGFCDRGNPHSGEMALRVSYQPVDPDVWAGVYWQYPANNWGGNPDGIDLRWANKVTFWARGARGGETVRFFVGGIGAALPYPDSVQPQVTTGWLKLTDQWQQYSINLAGKDLTRVVGGFGWVAEKVDPTSGLVFYLDDVIYTFDPALQP